MLSTARIRTMLLAIAAAPLLGSTAVPALYAQVWTVRKGYVSGTVRDTAGAPQTGAIVQVLSTDARLISSAVTDLRGRYRIANLPPGSYHLRASAALFLPAEKSGLTIRGGSRSVVDLTLSTLFSISDWIPAQRRAADEPEDDWMWTLRSSANRPTLRFSDDPNLGISSSAATESRKRAIATSGRVAVTSADGLFAHGGVHQAMTLTRMEGDGNTQMFRAEFSGSRSPYPVASSADVTTGMQGKVGYNGYSRSLVSYHSHPELVGKNGVTGLQAASFRSAERFLFGDTLVVDGGSLMREVNMGGNGIAMLPFVSIAVRPAKHLTVRYDYANAPEMQSFDDLDRVDVELPVAYSVNGHMRTERASHQAVALSAHSDRTVVEIAVFHNRNTATHLSGSGLLAASDLNTSNVVADPTTQTFRALAPSYSSVGYRVTVSQKLTANLTLAGEMENGSALVALDSAVQNLASAMASLQSQRATSVAVSLDGRVLRSGTRIRASYRWQPEQTLTAVDSFRSYGDPAYLSIRLRQPLRLAGFLPGGMEAVVDVTNLLAQGYQPFVSGDGHTLYLAQAPRMLQGGLAFTF